MVIRKKAQAKILEDEAKRDTKHQPSKKGLFGFLGLFTNERASEKESRQATVAPLPKKESGIEPGPKDPDWDAIEWEARRQQSSLYLRTRVIFTGRFGSGKTALGPTR